MQKKMTSGDANAISPKKMRVFGGRRSILVMLVPPLHASHGTRTLLSTIFGRLVCQALRLASLSN